MFDIHQAVFDEDGERDDDVINDYIDDLLAEFEDSPEGQAFLDAYDQIGWSASMMDLAINHLGCTPSDMTASDFEEIFYELIPRKIATEAENAPEIVAELRAFWQFVARQYALEHAQQIVEFLDDDAAKDLQEALSNPSKFGIAKSFFTMGLNAGFDMRSPEGMLAFQAAFNSSLPGSPMAGRGNKDFDPGTIRTIRPTMSQSVNNNLKKKREEKKRQRMAKKKNRSR